MFDLRDRKYIHTYIHTYILLWMSLVIHFTKDNQFYYWGIWIYWPSGFVQLCNLRYCNARAAMHEPQYAALSFSLTRTVLFLKEAALNSLLKTYQENYLNQSDLRFNLQLKNSGLVFSKNITKKKLKNKNNLFFFQMKC